MLSGERALASLVGTQKCVRVVFWRPRTGREEGGLEHNKKTKKWKPASPSLVRERQNEILTLSSPRARTPKCNPVTFLRSDKREESSHATPHTPKKLDQGSRDPGLASLRSAENATSKI